MCSSMTIIVQCVFHRRETKSMSAYGFGNSVCRAPAVIMVSKSDYTQGSTNAWACIMSDILSCSCACRLSMNGFFTLDTVTHSIYLVVSTFFYALFGWRYALNALGWYGVGPPLSLLSMRHSHPRLG